MADPIGTIGKGITNAAKGVADVVETAGEVAEKTASHLPDVAEKAAEGAEKAAEGVGKIGEVAPAIGNKINPAEVADELLGDAKAHGIEGALTDLAHGDFSGDSPHIGPPEEGAKISPFPQKAQTVPGVQKGPASVSLLHPKFNYPPAQPKVPDMEEGTPGINVVPSIPKGQPKLEEIGEGASGTKNKLGSSEKSYGEGKNVTDEELEAILSHRNSMIHPDHNIAMADIPLVHHTVYSDFISGHVDIFRSLSVTSKALLDGHCKKALSAYQGSPTKENAQNLMTALDNSSKRIAWKEKECKHGVPIDKPCAQCAAEKSGQ